MARVRIISLNAWGGAMFEELVGWLGSAHPDVVCLQEVTRTPNASGWTHFDDGERTLPQRANLFEDVRGVLPAHQSIFVASDAGPVRDDSGVRRQQDFGVATFVVERFTVVGIQTEFVHGSFVHHEEWATEDRPRVAVSTRLVDRGERSTVTIVQLHGLRSPAGKHDTPARRTQAERLADLIERSRVPGDLTVVCGDFNVLPDSDTFDVLKGVGMVDLVGSADTRTSRYRKPVRHAGYLLVSDPGAVARFEVVADPEVSDHRAMLLEV